MFPEFSIAELVQDTIPHKRDWYIKIKSGIIICNRQAIQRTVRIAKENCLENFLKQTIKRKLFGKPQKKNRSGKRAEQRESRMESCF